jgi:2-polyprenyl-3-methyl-5-hydroxy-6-metoxy-1,4-benzoquinol methylase
MTMPLETLEKLTLARNYNRWVYELCRPYLGTRLLEIGCGIGTMTEFWLNHGQLLATDIDPLHLREARQRWRGQKNLSTGLWDVAAAPAGEVLAYAPDTVLCINILEHVQDDAQALKNIHGLLAPGGRLVLFVPALPSLHGTLDQELLHFRRYGKKQVRALAAAAGFAEEASRYVNAPGVFGWWLNSKLLQRRFFSPNQIALFDRLIPFIAGLEKILPPPLGQSFLYIGKRK